MSWETALDCWDYYINCPYQEHDAWKRLDADLQKSIKSNDGFNMESFFLWLIERTPVDFSTYPLYLRLNQSLLHPKLFSVNLLDTLAEKLERHSYPSDEFLQGALSLHQYVRVHHPEYSASSFRVVQAGTPHRDLALQHLEQDWDPAYELEHLPQLAAIPARFNDELLNYITETSWWNINIHLHALNYLDVPMLGLLLSNDAASYHRSCLPFLGSTLEQSPWAHFNGWILNIVAIQHPNWFDEEVLSIIRAHPVAETVLAYYPGVAALNTVRVVILENTLSSGLQVQSIQAQGLVESYRLFEAYLRQPPALTASPEMDMFTV